MSKTDAIEFIAEKVGLSKADVERVINAFFEYIMVSLKKGLNVAFVGFGTFKVSQRAAREGRNPRTGEKIKIPAMLMPVFKAGKKLKDALN